MIPTNVDHSSNSDNDNDDNNDKAMLYNKRLPMQDSAGGRVGAEAIFVPGGQYILLYYIVLYHTMLYYITLYHIIL